MTASGILVAGYGNTLRGDDGAGPAVAAAAARDPRLAGVDVRALHQLTPELAMDVSRASLVILVDADSGHTPGTVLVQRLADTPDAAGDAAPAWSHHLAPESLAALARDLWGAAPPVFMVRLGVSSLGVGEGLSAAVASAVPVAVDAVAALVSEHGRA